MQKVEIAFSSNHLLEAHTCCSNVKLTLWGMGMTLRMVHGRQCGNLTNRNWLKTHRCRQNIPRTLITSSNVIHRHVKWRKPNFLEVILEYVRLLKPNDASTHLHIFHTKCCINFSTSMWEYNHYNKHPKHTRMWSSIGCQSNYCRTTESEKKNPKLERRKYGSGSVSRTWSFIKDCERLG